MIGLLTTHFATLLSLLPVGGGAFGKVFLVLIGYITCATGVVNHILSAPEEFLQGLSAVVKWIRVNLIQSPIIRVESTMS